jgi:LysR family glycine cleavage system transcriptional activator
MAAQGIEPPRSMKRLKFDHVFVLMEAASRGLGVAILPYSITAGALEAGTLIEPLPGMRMPYPNMYALYPEEERRPSSVKTFLAWLVEQGEQFSGRLEHPNPFSFHHNQPQPVAH